MVHERGGRGGHLHLILLERAGGGVWRAGGLGGLGDWGIWGLVGEAGRGEGGRRGHPSQNPTINSQP